MSSGGQYVALFMFTNECVNLIGYLRRFYQLGHLISYEYFSCALFCVAINKPSLTNTKKELSLADKIKQLLYTAEENLQAKAVLVKKS